jgi:hypothetical protein
MFTLALPCSAFNGSSSSAQNAGVKEGDVFVRVEDVSCLGMSDHELKALIGSLSRPIRIYFQVAISRTSIHAIPLLTLRAYPVLLQHPPDVSLASFNSMGNAAVGQSGVEKYCFNYANSLAFCLAGEQVRMCAKAEIGGKLCFK